jgi:hypothetical protein
MQNANFRFALPQASRKTRQFLYAGFTEVKRPVNQVKKRVPTEMGYSRGVGP